MSASIYSDHATALAEITGELGQSFTWNGSSYACVYSRNAFSNAVVEGGLETAIRGTVTTLVSLFATMPKQGQYVTINAERLVIGAVRYDPQNPVLSFDVT